MPGLTERVAELEDRVRGNDVQAAEHFREQFGLLSGAINRLDGKVTALDRRLDRFERDVKAAFVAVDARFDSMSADLKTLLRRTAPVRRTTARSKKKR